MGNAWGKPLAHCAAIVSFSTTASPGRGNGFAAANESIRHVVSGHAQSKPSCVVGVVVVAFGFGVALAGGFEFGLNNDGNK